MVSVSIRITTPETVRSIGAYPSFAMVSTYSPRAMRTLVNGDVPSTVAALAASPPVKRFNETVAPGGSVVTETVSEIVGITLVIVGSRGR